MEFLVLLEGIRNPFLDSFFQMVTYLGQELGILAAICLFYWCLDKHFAYRLGFIYFSAGLCVQTLKITFRIPRPWILRPGFQAVESAVPAATGYSFPSGHTQGGTCLFAPLALKLKPVWAKVLCVLAFICIGFSRMYLGVHTPKDVLVSMGISLLFTAVFWKYGDLLLDDDKHTGLISVILFVCSVLTAVYALVLHQNGTIEAKYAADCCKAAGAGLGFAAGFYLERTRLGFSSSCGSKKVLFYRLTAGLLLTLLVKTIVKKALLLLLGDVVFLGIPEYFAVVLFVIYFYPLLFTKMQKKPLQ